MKRKILVFIANFAVVLCTLFFGTEAFSAPPIRQFSATIAQPSAEAGAHSVAFTIRITNNANSTHNIGSASIAIPQIPSLFPQFSSLTDKNITASNSKTWHISTASSGYTIILGAGGIGGTSAGTNTLAAGQYVEFSFKADVPCTTGDYTWLTAAYQDPLDNESLQTGTPFSNTAQPILTVSNTQNLCALTGFEDGDYCTYGHGGWGANAQGNNPGAMRDAGFASVYPSGVIIGNIPNYYMSFSSSSAINAYLPAGDGTPGNLTNNHVNPTTPPGTESGVFGGQVLALRLNVDYNAAGKTSSLKTDFGSGIIFDDPINPSNPLNGKTIEEILDVLEFALGGGAPLPIGYTISNLNALANSLNDSFSSCNVSDFAETYLSPKQ